MPQVNEDKYITNYTSAASSSVQETLVLFFCVIASVSSKNFFFDVFLLHGCFYAAYPVYHHLQLSASSRP